MSSIILIISFSWISFIFILVLEYNSGFNEKDVIGAVFMFIVYGTISITLIIGVLRFTLVEYEISRGKIKVSRIGKKTETILWEKLKKYPID